MSGRTRDQVSLLNVKGCWMKIRSLFPLPLEYGTYSIKKEEEKKGKKKPPTQFMASCVKYLLSLTMSTSAAMPIKAVLIVGNIHISLEQ